MTLAIVRLPHVGQRVSHTRHHWRTITTRLASSGPVSAAAAFRRTYAATARRARTASPSALRVRPALRVARPTPSLPSPCASAVGLPSASSSRDDLHAPTAVRALEPIRRGMGVGVGSQTNTDRRATGYTSRVGGVSHSVPHGRHRVHLDGRTLAKDQDGARRHANSHRNFVCVGARSTRGLPFCGLLHEPPPASPTSAKPAARRLVPPSCGSVYVTSR
jgi:hypothetical protein